MEIPEVILPWTGKVDGDDAGYRDVAVSSLDQEDPDPLVGICCPLSYYPVYADGPAPRICLAYDGGLGASKTMLVRTPVEAAIHRANHVLHMYGRRLLILDGFRFMETQRRLWQYLFFQILGDRQYNQVTTTEFLRMGMRADDIGSFAALAQNDRLAEYHDLLMREKANDLLRASRELHITIDQAALLFLTFVRNLGNNELELDVTSNTAHGGGGAIDAILVDAETDEPTLLGVPFDYAGTPSAMRFFEDPDNLGPYQEAVVNDPMLRTFLSQFGVTDVTADVFNRIRDERRLFFHCMTRVGATHFFLECWHWNMGNQFGGKHFAAMPFGGSACHSLLKGVTNPSTGEWIADWGNAFAQTRAAEILS
ncbi:MAG: hypothetical protein UY52_C0001G0076 [Parcubacteria group bacterium GW2011_GWC2_49_9]|nr:MAG: hypothetical protein UY52_C0001G0076 [Parcubacteria group bacterium GW2011_GWC2_49_9]